MMRFAFYVHNHQPSGNFNEVFEYAYKHSYLPFLEVLTKHKTIKFGIHNSGTLLAWIQKKHPEFFEILRESVASGQCEILTSAYAEPILSFIPKQDMLDQIRYFNDYLHEHFGYAPKGLWLTERIWEPQLISRLLDAGIHYTLLDDTHFLYAGLEENQLTSYYITEEEGRTLKIFPISMKLRYLIPFHPVADTFNYFKKEEELNPDVLKTLGDDGEKFGVWPGTFDWVHTKGWLDDFLTRLEETSWIRTVLLDDVVRETPAGRVYLPTSSYEEMGEWVLLPQRGREYEDLKKTIDKKYFYLIHGGYFRNFLQKYPEANIMHKRMLYVSKRKPNTPATKQALWMGQCSCAYWHGIFGGLYLPHLREAVYRNLIEADNYNVTQESKIMDFDADGKNEIVFSDKNFFAVIDPAAAAFIEFDDRKRKMNLLNYLGRREEKYHRAIPDDDTQTGGKSIHEIVQSKEKNLNEYLIYDRYERKFGLDHALSDTPSVESFHHGDTKGTLLKYHTYKTDTKLTFTIVFTGDLEKTITFSGKNNREIFLTYKGDIPLLGVEFSLGIFNNQLQLSSGESLTTMNTCTKIDHFNITAADFAPIRFSASTTFDLLTYPIETVSSSEAGFEKIFQGFTLLLLFHVMPRITIQV